MRTVSYFLAGDVADFRIPADRFDDFDRNMPFDRRHSESDLDMARMVLQSFLEAGRERIGPQEVLAACFVWNFFNTHPDDGGRIDGDVLIVDLHGGGGTVEYASPGDVELRVAPSD